MFTEIYPKFHQLYPNYQLRPIEMGVMEQLNALSRFEIDLAFVTIDNDQRDDNNYITVGTEEMICAIHSILKVSANLACAIIPKYYVNPNAENISYYKLHGNPSWDMCFVYNKDGYLSDGMKAFIDLSKDYWDNSPHVQLPM